MLNSADLMKAKRELHRQVELLTEAEIGNGKFTWERFKGWASRVLRNIGIFIDDLFDSAAYILESIWKGLRTALGH